MLSGVFWLNEICKIFCCFFFQITKVYVFRKRFENPPLIFSPIEYALPFVFPKAVRKHTEFLSIIRLVSGKQTGFTWSVIFIGLENKSTKNRYLDKWSSAYSVFTLRRLCNNVGRWGKVKKTVVLWNYTVDYKMVPDHILEKKSYLSATESVWDTFVGRVTMWAYL